MQDLRSRKALFVTHCMLAQCVMAEGLVKKYPAIVRPVLEFCLHHDINIIQMPCPETLCAAGGLGRETHGKAWYEKNGLRETSLNIAKSQASYIANLLEKGIKVLGVVGIEFSPACAVNYLNKGRMLVKDKGIYTEELQRELAERNIQVPFIGISGRWEKKMQEDLNKLLLV